MISFSLLIKTTIKNFYERDQIMSQVTNEEALSKGQATSPKQALAISARELAEKLSLSPRTIWRLLSAGKLPRPLSIGGSKRFLLSDVNLFVECGCDMAVYKARREQGAC